MTTQIEITTPAAAGLWETMPKTEATRLYRTWQEAEWHLHTLEEEGADYEASDAADTAALEAQAAILAAPVTGPADLAVMILAATDGETGPLIDPLKAIARQALCVSPKVKPDWFAKWNGIQAAYHGCKTDEEIATVIEREEKLIHDLGADPSGERDLATMVVANFDNGFANKRLIGPMVAYSMRVLARG